MLVKFDTNFLTESKKTTSFFKRYNKAKKMQKLLLKKFLLYTDIMTSTWDLKNAEPKRNLRVTNILTNIDNICAEFNHVVNLKPIYLGKDCVLSDFTALFSYPIENQIRIVFYLLKYNNIYDGDFKEYLEEYSENILIHCIEPLFDAQSIKKFIQISTSLTKEQVIKKLLSYIQKLKFIPLAHKEKDDKMLFVFDDQEMPCAT